MHILSPLLAVAQVFVDQASCTWALELLLSLLAGDFAGSGHVGWAAFMVGNAAATGHTTKVSAGLSTGLSTTWWTVHCPPTVHR